VSGKKTYSLKEWLGGTSKESEDWLSTEKRKGPLPTIGVRVQTEGEKILLQGEIR